MAGAVADRAFRETVPDRIEADLAALWREVGARDAPVARATMSNFVVFRDRRAGSDPRPAAVAEGLPLEAVAARHPSRTIVLEHCHDPAPKGAFSAGVGITIFGPPHARYGVEQIVVCSACPDEALLSLLRRFVRGDLPTTVWWTEDLSAAPALDPFVEVGRQLLYDSRRWRDVRRGIAAVAAVIAGERIDPADLNWRRLTPLRRALEHARGPLASAAWREVAVHIEAAPGQEALAWLCAGWLRAARREPYRANVIVETAKRPRAAGADAHLIEVSVDGLTAALTDRGAVVDSAIPPLVIAAKVESDADAIAAELRSLARDAALVGAVRALADDFSKSAFQN